MRNASHLFFHSWGTCSSTLSYRIQCDIIPLCVFFQLCQNPLLSVYLGYFLWVLNLHANISTLSFFFFFPHFPLSHSPYSYQQFLFPCLDSGLYKGECEFRSLWMSLICRAEMVCWVKLRSLLTQQAWMYSFLRARVKVHPWWRELPSCKIFHS